MIYSKDGLLYRAKGKTRVGGEIIDCPEADRIAAANGQWCAERIVKEIAHIYVVEVDDVTLQVLRFFKDPVAQAAQEKMIDEWEAQKKG